MIKEYGAKNILYATVHMDEKNTAYALKNNKVTLYTFS
ncbi:hypothetical protein [Staphylococcus epidermidis]